MSHELLVILRMEKLSGGGYRLGDLFEIQSTPSFNKDALTQGNEYDYVTRTSQNQGILQATGFVNEENVNLPGSWSLGLLQMDFFYRRKSWYAGQFVRKVTPKVDIKNERIALFFSTLLNKQKKSLLSVLVRDIDSLFESTRILIPVENNVPNYDYMELLISAIQKIIVKDMVLYTNEKSISAGQLVE